ncbi:MAG TPA: LysR family transcriptional regulator [Aquabacterium sp.]|nr:LysR family transcriptional regulator [Aquabacterium sp.]
MQLKSLSMFEAVCATGSFGAAAQQLHTVQSNVTAHIKKLEDELGAQLLERSAPVHPTSAGQALRPYAQRMLQLHAEASALFTPHSPPAGSLRIGAMETTAALRLPPVLAQLHQQHPLIDLQLRTGPTATLLEALAHGELDCALVAGHPPQPRWHAHEVFVEELVLVGAQPLKRLPSAEVLLHTPFLAFRQGCSYRQRVELLLASQGITAARIMEMGTLDAILGCVAAGMGHALLPEAVVQAQQHRFGVHWMRLPGPLRADIARVGTCFVAGPAHTWSPALRACATLLKVPPARPVTRPGGSSA